MDAIRVDSRALHPSVRQGKNRLMALLQEIGGLSYHLQKRLGMGTEYSVSRYVSQIQNRDRVGARKLLERLTANTFESGWPAAV